MALDYDILTKELQRRGKNFNRLTDPKGKPIEDKIKPLVLVLNHLGYKTSASCGGHSLDEHKERSAKHDGWEMTEEDKYHFVLQRPFGKGMAKIIFDQAPFVDLSIDTKQQQRLEEIIKKYNSMQTIPWQFQKIEQDTRLSPEYHHTLEELQNTVPIVSEFIYNQHQ